MIEDKDKQKAVGVLIERILWRMRLTDEMLSVYGFYFRNSDIFNREKPTTKAAISSAIDFLSSIKPLDPFWSASPLKTGGIILVKDDETPNNVLITERGTVLSAQKDIKAYMDSNKL